MAGRLAYFASLSVLLRDIRFAQRMQRLAKYSKKGASPLSRQVTEFDVQSNQPALLLDNRSTALLESAALRKAVRGAVKGGPQQRGI